jgi:hypothetical protein
LTRFRTTLGECLPVYGRLQSCVRKHIPIEYTPNCYRGFASVLNSNWLGTRTWEKLISIGPICNGALDGTVVALSLVAHSEVASSQPDGTVALGAISMKAYAIDQTKGNVEDDSWYEIVNFQITCHCQYSKGSHDGNKKYELDPSYPTTTVTTTTRTSPSVQPTTVPSSKPTAAPSWSPSAAPSKLPSQFPSSAPSLAPKYQCRPAWAVGRERLAHCFKTTVGLTQRSNETTFPEWGFYNGIVHLLTPEKMDLYVQVPIDEDAPDGEEECPPGAQKVGSVNFSYSKKVVTVELRTIGDMVMTSSQVHVGPDLLPSDPQDGSFITDPHKFELVHPDLEDATSDYYYLHGCQEDNWVAARAVVCGTFI